MRAGHVSSKALEKMEQQEAVQSSSALIDDDGEGDGDGDGDGEGEYEQERLGSELRANDDDHHAPEVPRAQRSAASSVGGKPVAGARTSVAGSGSPDHHHTTATATGATAGTGANSTGIDAVVRVGDVLRLGRGIAHNQLQKQGREGGGQARVVAAEAAAARGVLARRPGNQKLWFNLDATRAYSEDAAVAPDADLFGNQQSPSRDQHMKGGGSEDAARVRKKLLYATDTLLGPQRAIFSPDALSAFALLGKKCDNITTFETTV